MRSEGPILLDGVDIRSKTQGLEDSPLSSCRVFLFSGDIMSNIRLDNESISDADAMQAAEYVSANNFIERLPGGYHEEVHERIRCPPARSSCFHLPARSRSIRRSWSSTRLPRALTQRRKS